MQTLQCQISNLTDLWSQAQISTDLQPSDDVTMRHDVTMMS